LEARHVLRVEPELSTELFARLTIRFNMARMLSEARKKAEQVQGTAHFTSAMTGR
jgi:hypothetical protein